MTYDTGGMPDDWTPPPPPDVGSKRWLDDMAFSFMVESFGGLPDRSGVFKLPNVVAGGKSYPLGYFILLSLTVIGHEFNRRTSPVGKPSPDAMRL